MPSIPATHKAVASPAIRAPLVLIDAPTVLPRPGDVLVRQEWTASTPLDLHQADGGLLVAHPQILGDGFAGTVVALGPPSSDADLTLRDLQVGDKVFGFAWREPKERTHQEYITVPACLVGKVPPGIPLQAAVTVPNNLVTAFNVLTTDLGLELPWPVPSGWRSPLAEVPVLVWGAASSVGTYTIQVLRHWGYRNVLAIASGKHHAHLAELGATACFDYRDEDIVAKVLGHVGPPEKGPQVPLIVDCIGSAHGSLEPLTRIAQAGTKLAVMLPVIVRDATENEVPEYEMDVKAVHAGLWADGVDLRGCRTHLYLQNEFFKDHLQPEIVPELLEKGIIRPNKQRVVEGATLLERAQAALDLLRSRDPSGERLVWRISDLGGIEGE